MRYLVLLLILPLVFAQACIEDTDCSDETGCYNGTCEPLCMDDSDCESATCDNYVCVPETNLTIDTEINLTSNTTLNNSNTSNITNNFSETRELENNFSITVNNIQTEIEMLTSNTEGLEARLDTIESKLTTMDSKLSSIDNEAELQALQTKVEEALSNIAALRTNVETTQTDIESVQVGLETTADTTSLTRILSIIAIIITLSLGISLYIFHHNGREEELDPEIVNYITGHIKQGNNYDKIKEHLLKAGWTKDQIDEAYKKVKTHNYHKYLKDNGRGHEVPSKAINHKKPVIIASASFLIIMIIIMFMGSTTGQAVYYTLDSSSTVSDYILAAYEGSGFTEMVSIYDVCIQFPTYTGEQVSKRFIRTETSYGVYDAATHCWERDTDSFSVMFESQEDFETMMEAIATGSPSTMASVANILNIIVLPSDYVAPGFYARKDYTKFCTSAYQFHSWISSNLGITYEELFPDCIE